jgi:hypothetical protein
MDPAEARLAEIGERMAWTQSDVDTLKEAIKNGAVLQSIQFADQTYTFRTMDDMLKLLSVMQGEVGSGARSYRLAATSKGA